MERADVVLRSHPSRPDRIVDPGSKALERDGCRCVECQHQGVGVRRRDLRDGVLARTDVVGRGGGMVRIDHHVRPPVHDVGGRPRLAVGPAQPLTEVEGPDAGIGVRLPRLRQSGHDVGAVVDVTDDRVPVTEFVDRRIRRVGQAHSHQAAVGPPAEPGVRDDVRLGGDPLGELRQLARGDLIVSRGDSCSVPGTASGLVREPLSADPLLPAADPDPLPDEDFPQPTRLPRRATRR